MINYFNLYFRISEEDNNKIVNTLLINLKRIINEKIESDIILLIEEVSICLIRIFQFKINDSFLEEKIIEEFLNQISKALTFKKTIHLLNAKIGIRRLDELKGVLKEYVNENTIKVYNKELENIREQIITILWADSTVLFFKNEKEYLNLIDESFLILNRKDSSFIKSKIEESLEDILQKSQEEKQFKKRLEFLYKFKKYKKLNELLKMKGEKLNETFLKNFNKKIEKEEEAIIKQIVDIKKKEVCNDIVITLMCYLRIIDEYSVDYKKIIFYLNSQVECPRVCKYFLQKITGKQVELNNNEKIEVSKLMGQFGFLLE